MITADAGRFKPDKVAVVSSADTLTLNDCRLPSASSDIWLFDQFDPSAAGFIDFENTIITWPFSPIPVEPLAGVTAAPRRRRVRVAAVVKLADAPPPLFPARS